jgi:hypothetical protein
MAEHSTVATTSAVRPNGPARQVIATVDNYADVERAVDYLSDQRFEVNRVAIVGGDLQYVEQVLGRLNYGGAAPRGAGSGALVGALIGLLIHALQGGRRDFHSVSGLLPKYYDVVADVEVSDRALQILTSDNRRE